MSKNNKNNKGGIVFGKPSGESGQLFCDVVNASLNKAKKNLPKEIPLENTHTGKKFILKPVK